MKHFKGRFGRFKHLEDEGRIPPRVSSQIDALCRSLNGTAERLVNGLDSWSVEIAHDLQLLTLGPQFRGSENTRIGRAATREVQELIRAIVRNSLHEETDRTFLLRNASGRPVLIEFSSDPDVRVTETLPTSVRPTLSIEIKGGTDDSNIHNRLGEAEKSHLKARRLGFREFWTILRSALDFDSARRASPTTGRFFRLDEITDPDSEAHAEFSDLFAALLGIKS